MKYSKITIFLGVYLLGWGLLISIYLGAIFPFLTTILLVLVLTSWLKNFPNGNWRRLEISTVYRKFFWRILIQL